ncbi:MAG: transposase [Endomicrobium sp.]|nr:transposase [Endomicrobium sp.]
MSKNSPSGFIRYQSRSKRPDGSEYAIYCPPCHGNPNPEKRIDKDIWLGKVLDKEKGVYYNTKQGPFVFNIESGFQTLSTSEIKMYEKILTESSNSIVKTNKSYNLSIDFGDIYILTEYLKKEHLLDLFTYSLDCNKDTLISLIIFRIICSKSNKFAFNWWNETFTKFLFPEAQLKSQQISNFLIDLGSEINFRKYIIDHINYIRCLTPKYFILIDSTGLPNDIKIPITAINNHNGIVNNEIRLIMVIESNTGLPVYYRYVPGNIIDVSTLNMIIMELREYNIRVNRAVLDAGYYSKENLIYLYDNNIPFITRMVEKVLDHKKLISEHKSSIKSRNNYINFNNRHLYIKKVPIQLFNGLISAFAYLCLDIDKEHQDQIKFLTNHIENASNEELEIASNKFGIFIILSTIDFPSNEILPYYYTRQDIEQIFDYLKNEIDVLPIRVHSEASFSGHLLLSFMALTAYKSLHKSLKLNNINIKNAFDALSRYHCRVYKNRIIPDVANKSVNDICKALKIKLPKTIDIKGIKTLF